MSKIRVGVQWAPAMPGPELAAFSRELEDLGYFSLGFPDHYFVGKGPDFVPLHEPFAAMSYVGAVTTRLRLVCIVAANDFRHPALYARAVASIDVLSDGRVEAGIGAGWFGPEFDAIGTPFDTPGVRIDRLEEAIAVIKSLWTNGRTDYSGKHYRISGAPGLPKPIQRPHPPLLIGAGGPKMLNLAGRHADVVGLTSNLRNFEDRAGMLKEMSPQSIKTKIEIIRQAAAAAGRDVPEIQIQINSIEFEGEDPGHMWALTGDPARLIDLLHERREMGISYFMLRERRLERLREFGEKVVSKL